MKEVATTRQKATTSESRTLAEAHLDIGLANNYRIEYIKHLMSIATGVFVFSVTFMKDMIGSSTVGASLKSALLVGWISLAISIVAGILHMRLWASFYISWGLHYNELSARQWRYKIRIVRDCAEIIQIAGFVVGIFALLLFAAQNLNY